MLSVVIADDEKGIVELIKHLLDPQIVQAKIVGEACNGIEAYELIIKEKPDVVITDIRMPGLTGIELIQRCQNESPHTAFVMISGFQEFSYAQAALQYGAVNYLLKPLKKKSLNETLAKIDRAKGAAATHMAKALEESRALSTNTGILRKQSILRLVSDQKISAETLSVFEAASVFNQQDGEYCIGVIKLANRIHPNMPVSHDTVDVLLEKISRFMKNECIDVESCCLESTGILYLHYNEKAYPISEQIKKLEKEISADKYQFELLDITVGFGSVESSPQGLVRSFAAARDAVRSRIDMGGSVVLKFDERLHELPKTAIGVVEMMRMKRALEQMDQEELCRAIQDIFNAWRAERKKQSSLYIIAEEILKYIYQELTVNLPECQISDYEESCRRIDQLMYSSALEEVCIEYARMVITQCNAQKENAISKPVREICRYLQKNYKEPFSLKNMARMVTLSPVYVSSMFKKEMGVSISSYFTEVRMEKAKELLKTTPMSVAAIAEAVGYQDTRYFSKLFIKTVGIKPMDYRKFYS